MRRRTMAKFNDLITNLTKEVNTAVKERREYVKIYKQTKPVAEVEELASAKFKGTLADRGRRNQVVFGLIADYILANDRMPDVNQITRLNDILLCEEITDNHPDKMSREEYPIISETQLARRHAGVHRKNDGGGLREVPFHLVENFGTDGMPYEYPTRRKRTRQEETCVDEKTQSRNAQRRKSYRDFINGKTAGMFTVDVQTGSKIVYEKPAECADGAVVREWSGNNLVEIYAK
ncbi:hypothetical protein [Bacillus sp. JJ722]|uniref:hypothetical protein n=1 Tax=Bacillus sp. JJ722 TaxID=3122973 RepID=UPI003000D9FB